MRQIIGLLIVRHFATVAARDGFFMPAIRSKPGHNLLLFFDRMRIKGGNVHHILAIDDDRTVLRLIEKALDDSNFQITTVSTAEEGWSRMVEGDIEVCLLDIMLPEMSGLELAEKIRELDARLPVIFITSLSDSGTAIEAMKLGAYEFCTKPLDVQHVQDLVEKALETRRLMRSPVTFQRDQETPSDDGVQLVGNSPEMLEVYKQIGRVAAQQVPVLIRGESGTGKELIARAIYQHSHRKHQCYLAVNCAALSESLLESELFGHEKGAFTGADRCHIGKFEQCNGGTIFLDEVGDMSPLLQSKVLRLLQERTFERVGGRETIETDVRVISATNRDIEQMIEENEFRLDLYHRINSIEIHLPALRDRGDDINLFISHFVRRVSQQMDKNIEGISSDAMELLREYRWPGNVRELHSVVRRAILMSPGPVIVSENLPEDLLGGSIEVSAESEHSTSQSSAGQIASFAQSRIDAGSNDIYTETLKVMERALISTILTETSGNQSKAAKLLGITRGSLRNKIRSLGIVIEQIVSTDS